MNDLELIFSMLGEAATTEITRTKNVEGFDKTKKAVKAISSQTKNNARPVPEQVKKSLLWNTSHQKGLLDDAVGHDP